MLYIFFVVCCVVVYIIALIVNIADYAKEY